MLRYMRLNGAQMVEENEMLEFLGVDSVEELFADIPEEIKSDLSLEEGKSEMEVVNKVKKKLSKNVNQDEISSFIGGGIYRHYIPAAVNEVIGKSEFYTSYTPYQAEVSQGMLQSLFEYQSLICELTGMDAANTSMYDYSTAFAEAVLMSIRVGKGNKFLVPENIHWDKDSVLKNYLRGNDIEIEHVKYDEKTGCIDIEDFKSKVDDDLLGFYVESPNFFGVLEENLDELKKIKEDKDAIFVAGISPLSLSLLKPPSEWGADIVVGDSQALGIPASFGGPTVGIFACKKRYIRKMPGRIIGETEDADGKTAYCMTLQTREQHIRRERATSNICTNQSLMALASAVYMYVKGGKGLEELAKQNYEKSHEVAEKIDELDGYEAPYFDSPFFNEFLVKTPVKADEIIEKASKKGILPGIDISKEDKFADMENTLLLSVTEMNDESEIDELVDIFREVKE